MSKLLIQLFFALILSKLVVGKTDRTLEALAFGSDIVDAVIEKLHNSGIFDSDDQGILKRIA